MEVLESIGSIASKGLPIIHVIAVLGITRNFACSMHSSAISMYREPVHFL